MYHSTSSGQGPSFGSGTSPSFIPGSSSDPLSISSTSPTPNTSPQSSTSPSLIPGQQLHPKWTSQEAAAPIGTPLAISSDGSMLVVCTVDLRQVQGFSFDGSSGLKHAWTLDESSKSILSVALSGDGRWLATNEMKSYNGPDGKWVHEPGNLRVYAFSGSSKPTLKWTLTDIYFSTLPSIPMVLSGDGKWLAISGDDRISEITKPRAYALDGVSEPQLSVTLDDEEPNQPVAVSFSFSPDGKWLAAGGQDGRLRVYALTGSASINRKPTWTVIPTDFALNWGGLYSVEFVVGDSGGDYSLIGSSLNGGVTTYSFDGSTQPAQRWHETVNSWSVAVSGNRHMLAVGEASAVTSDVAKVYEFHEHDGPVLKWTLLGAGSASDVLVAFMGSEGRWLATSSRAGKSVQIYDLEPEPQQVLRDLPLRLRGL